MSALFIPLSTPARRVEPCDPMPLSVQRFSRVLYEKNGCIRSSNAVIVPMPDTAPMHPADRIVLAGCAVGGIALIVFASIGWLP